MNKNRILALGAALVFRGGCSLAPKYTRPEAPVPAAWPAGAAYDNALVSPGAPAAAAMPWREVFTDARLRQVMEMALAGNRDLRIAALNVERARALYGVQRAELFPTEARATAGAWLVNAGILGGLGGFLAGRFAIGAWGVPVTIAGLGGILLASMTLLALLPETKGSDVVGATRAAESTASRAP